MARRPLREDWAELGDEELLDLRMADLPLTVEGILADRIAQLRSELDDRGLRFPLHFYIAEEGTTAAAYVILTVVGQAWTLEECGDRDASGARVGALLQALIAREPAERRPTIRAWLPPRFLPPQVTIASTAPSTETIAVRMLGSRATAAPLSGDDVLFWHNDLV